MGDLVHPPAITRGYWQGPGRPRPTPPPQARGEARRKRGAPRCNDTGQEATSHRGHRDPRARLHTLIAELAPACDVQLPPRSEADILRQLRGTPSWHVLGTRRTQSGLTIRLARSPDERTGTGSFIRHGWRIVRAVVQAWLHDERTDDGRYVLTCRADFGLLEGATPGRFLLGAFQRLVRFKVLPWLSGQALPRRRGEDSSH